MSGPGRHAKLASAMRAALTQLVRDVKDPRVSKLVLISINHIDFNRDASIARIYVSFPGADERDIDPALQGLKSATRFIRGPLGRVMNLKRVPRLDFFADAGDRVAAELHQIVREDERRAAGPPPDDEPEEPPRE